MCVHTTYLQRMMTAEKKAGRREMICQAEELHNTAIIKKLNALRKQADRERVLAEAAGPDRADRHPMYDQNDRSCVSHLPSHSSR